MSRSGTGKNYTQKLKFSDHLVQFQFMKTFQTCFRLVLIKSYFHLDPVLWVEIIEAKPQPVEFPCEEEVPQWLDERHMDEEFEPARLPRCGELVEELSDVNHERGEHPTYSEDGPLWVVMVRVTVIQS